MAKAKARSLRFRSILLVREYIVWEKSEPNITMREIPVTVLSLNTRCGR